MGYWKGRHFALEQDFEAFRTEAGAFRTKNANLHTDMISLKRELSEVAKLAADRLSIIEVLERQALALRTTSQQLTNNCATLRESNNSLFTRLRHQELRLTPMLPPTPERVFVPCYRTHTVTNDIEARAALRKENDELRDQIVDLSCPPRDSVLLQGQVDRLRMSNQLLVQEVNGSNNRIKELKDMLRDVQAFVEALDRK